MQFHVCFVKKQMAFSVMHKNHSYALYIFFYLFLFCFLNAIMCHSITWKLVKDILMKLHRWEDMSCTRIITLACIFLELFPFDQFKMQFRDHSIFCLFLMKLQIYLLVDEKTCHAQDP